jgi:hypothetical protein
MRYAHIRFSKAVVCPLDYALSNYFPAECLSGEIQICHKFPNQTAPRAS